MRKTKETAKKIIRTSMANLNALIANEDCMNAISRASSMICQSIGKGGKLMICGNGGSAADSQHLAGEFVCRFLKNRSPLAAIALTTDTSVLTSVSNDYSYEEVFSRQVAAIGRPGDVLLGISTSGASQNVLGALREARKRGLKTMFLTADGCLPTDATDLVITVPSRETPRIQEMHLLVEHIIAELVEEELCGHD